MPLLKIITTFIEDSRVAADSKLIVQDLPGGLTFCIVAQNDVHKKVHIQSIKFDMRVKQQVYKIQFKLTLTISLLKPNGEGEAQEALNRRNHRRAHSMGIKMDTRTARKIKAESGDFKFCLVLYVVVT